MRPLNQKELHDEIVTIEVLGMWLNLPKTLALFYAPDLQPDVDVALSLGAVDLAPTVSGEAPNGYVIRPHKTEYLMPGQWRLEVIE
jgi:hypothetical protein